MYQDFSILTVETDMKNKTITLTASHDIDPETVTDANVQLHDRVTRECSLYKAVVQNKVVVLTLLDWPEPNVEYIINVKGLKTVLGDELKSGIRRKIIFKSAICSRVEFLQPAHQEVLSNLKATWKEVTPPDTHPAVNSFYIEISTENAFHNVLRKTEVEGRSELDIADLPTGQYYIRGRVQNSTEYGIWSETITFLIGPEAKAPDPIYEEPSDDPAPVPDEDDDVYTPDIVITTLPENGVTPTSILIEFDTDIDPTSLGEIIVIRRSI